MNILKTIAHIKEPVKSERQSEANGSTRTPKHVHANEEYEMLFERSPIGIDIVDMDGVIIYCNPAAYEASGYTREDYTGKHFTKLATIEKSIVPKFKELFKSTIKGEASQPFEYAYKRKDGTMGYTEIHYSLLEKGGQTTGILVFKKDITERKQAEEALAVEAIRRRILVEQSSDGIVILDENGKVYEANRRFVEMLGYSSEEVLQLSVWDWEFLYPHEQVKEMIRTVDEAGDHFETKHRRKDGTVYDVEISTNGAMFAGQKLIFCVCRDITERKRAEEALRESEEKYRDLFDHTDELIQSVKPDGHFRYVNNAWRETLGYNEEEIAELKVFDVVYPDYLEHFEIIFQKIFAGEDIGQLNTAFMSKEGKKILVEGKVNCKCVDGAPIYTRSIFRNVTRGRYMEDQMLRLSSAVSMSTNCILITDCYAKILDVNEKTLEMYGAKNKDELIGRHFLELITPADRKTANTDVEEIVAKGYLENRNYHMTSKDGNEFLVQMSTSLVKDVDGKPMGLVRVGKEISNSN